MVFRLNGKRKFYKNGSMRNTFLRAQFRQNPTNSITRRIRLSVSVVLGVCAFLLALSPAQLHAAIGFSGATIIPAAGTPSLVCSGNSATITLNISTCSLGSGPDWSASYQVDSSADGGTTWHTPSGVSSGLVASPTGSISYVTPVLTSTSCYIRTYRFRLTGIIAHCFGNVTFTSALSEIQVCPQPAPMTGTASICVGRTTTLSVAPTTGGTWSSSNIAIASVTSAGVVTGNGVGTALVAYTLSGGCSSSRVVTVNALPSAITGSTSVCQGATTTYALVIPSPGAWSSTNAAAGTINTISGAFSALAADTTTIVFTNVAGCTSSLSVTVNPLPAPIDCNVPVCVGGSQTLCSATTGGTWSSTTPAIASFPSSASGTFNGVTAGTTIVTYSTSAGCIDTAIVTVNPLPAVIVGANTLCAGSSSTYTNATAGGVWTSSDTAVIRFTTPTLGDVTAGVGGTARLTYTLPTGCFVTRSVTVNALPTLSLGSAICVGGTYTLTGTPAGGTWISSTPAVGTIGFTTGIFTGLTNGTSDITYTIGGGCLTVTPMTVNATPSAITGSLVLCGGSTTTLSSTPGGTWTSLNTSVATVGASSGVVTANPGAGLGDTATIVYTLAGGCSVRVVVTVNTSPGAISPAGPTVVCLGQSLTLSNPVAGGTWSSSATGVASVTSTGGVVTGVSVGTATITYRITAGGCFTTRTVSVEPVPAAISGTTVLCSGACAILSTPTPGGVWTSTNPAIATVDSATGTWCGGVAAGSDIISYSLPSGCRATIVVTNNPNPGPITGPAGVCVGNSATMSAGSSTVVWASSIPPLASIDAATGVVTGNIAGGPLTISATDPVTGCFSSVSFMVYANPLPIDGPDTVCVGSTITLNNFSPGGPGTWSSSNPAIADINTFTGILTGMNAGVARITYTLPTGCFTVGNVTVNPLPATLTGPARTCIGFCTTLSSTTPGGTWSSSDVTIATVSATGSVCGVSPGTAFITYTLPTSCFRVRVVTVDPIPTAPTGITSICVGGTTTLSHPIPGGTWSSSDTLVAKVFLGTGVVTGFIAGTANITYTTASGCTAFTTVTVNPIPPAITGIQYMCAGNTTTLSNLFAGGSWTSSDTTIATVSATGVVTGVAAGTSRISYTLASGCARTAVVTVYPLPAIIGSVIVCPGVASTLTGSPTGGLWVSSTPSIATIGSLSGVVTGLSTGTADITYTLATTCRSFAVVTVQPLPAAISGPTQVCAGSTITLINLTTGGGAWSSSTPSVATIDTAGVVTGVSAGTTTITFTAASTGCITTTVITVNPLPGAIGGPSVLCVNDSVTLASGSAGGTWSSSGGHGSINPTTGVFTATSAGVQLITYTLPTGCFTNYSVTVNPLPAAIAGVTSVCFGYTVLLSSSTPGGIWSITPPSVATIDTDGLVTGVSPGTATVTYTLLTTGCSITTVITVNPLPNPIGGILNLCVNDSTTLTSSTPGGTWTSDDPLIAVINPGSGLLATVSAGTVTITYTLPTGCYVTEVVTINPLVPPITGTLVLCNGDTTTLTNIITGGSWSSSNPAVATIGSASGFVTAVSPGTASITYTLPSSCPRVITFTVNPNPTPIAGSLTICQGDTTILTSTPGGGTWSSSNPGVAFIFMPTGQMIGITTGTSTITYKLPTGCETRATVVVNPVPTASSITGSRVICVGNTATLNNTAFPGGTWSSSAPGVALINTTTGNYLGVTAGTAVITYTLPTGCDTFITVTVNPLPSAIVGSLSICDGTSTALSNPTPGGTWSSSNPSVGTINATTGVFTALAPGNTVITYALVATGCQITAIMTVNPLPSTIVGPSNVCVGSTVILSSTPGGGVWSSSNPAIAPVTVITTDFDSASVVGLVAGTTNITYTLPTGCFTVFTVTVNNLPPPIQGADTVCVGSSVILSNPLSVLSGTWTSSDLTIATVASIDSVSAQVTGVSAGTAMITFTNSNGCEIDFLINVRPLPGAITGPINLCVGFSDTLKNDTTGGLWSVNDPLIATIVDTNGVFTGVSAGVATFTYMLPTGCFVTRDVNIRPLPNVTVNTPTIICKYASTVLTAAGADTYVWSPSTGLSTTTGPVVVASPTISTTYTVVGFTTFGCPDTTTVRVVVDSLLNDIAVVGKDTICKGECTVLMATGREGTFFSWKPATGLSCTICDTTTACPINTTTYNLLAIDSLGCRDSLFFTVHVMPLPLIRVLPDPVIVCNGSTTQVNVTDQAAAPGDVTRFAWFPNAFISCDTCNNPVLSNTTNLIYRVTGITEYGCVDSIRIPVTVLDSAFNTINKDTVICLGTSAQLYATSFNPDGSRSDYLWANSDITNKTIPNPVVTPFVTTTYTLTITPNVCFPRTYYTTVVVVPYPDISISTTPSNTTVAAGTPVTLRATVLNEMIISDYAWSPTSLVSCDTCYETVVTPTITTTYTFTATSQYGCTSTRDVTITVGCENSQVYIPNTFTPNGDGMNDIFLVRAKGVKMVNKFQIFNRWGEMVYERTNIPANDAGYGWDGQYKGVVLPPDVFYYFVEATCDQGEVFKYHGDVSIVK